MSHDKEHDALPKTDRGLARYYGVSERTIYRLRGRGAPIHDPEDFAAWLLKHPKSMTTGIRTRLAALRARGQMPKEDAMPPSSDYLEFERSAGAGPADEAGLIGQLKRQMAFALYKLNNAQRRGDTAGVDEATKQLRSISGVIHDEEMRALKLGREIGDTIPRTEVERFAHALAAASMRAIDHAMPTLARELIGKNHAKDVRAVLEPALLSARFFRPFVEATKVVNGQSLPRWLVEQITDAVDDYIENGSDLFRQQSYPCDTVADGSGI